MSGPNSNPYQMQGADNAGCGKPATGDVLPAIAVNDATDQSGRHRRHPLQPHWRITQAAAADSGRETSLTMPAASRSMAASKPGRHD